MTKIEKEKYLEKYNKRKCAYNGVYVYINLQPLKFL